MSSWPYTLRTKQWSERRADQLRRFPLCFDCGQEGKAADPAVEVFCIGSEMISVCAKHAMQRRRPGKG